MSRRAPPGRRRRPDGSRSPRSAARRRRSARSPSSPALQRLRLLSVGFLQLLHRLLRLLLTGRLAMEAEPVLHEGDAAAFLGLADDRGRTLEGAAALERLD